MPARDVGPTIGPARPAAVVALALTLVVALAALTLTAPGPGPSARDPDEASALEPREPGAARAAGRLRPVRAPAGIRAAADPDAYWTPRRMAAARTKRVTLPRRTGRAARAAAQASVYDYPFPFSRRNLEQPLYRLAPYRAVGKVYFTQGGFDYVCSGSSVVSAPRNVVFTAGHCLNDGFGVDDENWSRNVVFVPAKNGTREPHGRFRARRSGGAEEIWVLGEWAFLGNLKYDIGAFAVRPNARGRTLQQSVGALKFRYGRSRTQHWHVLGYPALGPFSGRRMIACATSHATDDLADDIGEGPPPIGVGCDMSGGSSGGPWITRLRRDNFLNSVVSYGYIDEPRALYGPYFDEAANLLRCAAATADPFVESC
jgi:V8-like Glu-specific endopeptidase